MTESLVSLHNGFVDLCELCIVSVSLPRDMQKCLNFGFATLQNQPETESNIAV